MNPESGGAEVLTDALASHLAKNNEVFFITSSFPGSLNKQTHANYTILRKGNTLTCILHAFFIYKKLSREKRLDLIIDQAHGVPFFSILYPNRPKIFTLIHEVAGELWSAILPIKIGYAIDNIWIPLYRSAMWLTVSASTKKELIGHGIPDSQISIIPNFTAIQLEAIPQKNTHPTLLVLGRIAPVKQIEHAIAVFRIAKKTIPNLQLIIAGKTSKKYISYHKKISFLAAQDTAITIKVNISEQEKIELLKKSHILLMPSKKEGYGIAILEANACGTPAIGYDVPGIRDAIINNTTGLLATPKDYNNLASYCTLLLTNPAIYGSIQKSAHTHACAQTKTQTYSHFDAALCLSF